MIASGSAGEAGEPARRGATSISERPIDPDLSATRQVDGRLGEDEVDRAMTTGVTLQHVKRGRSVRGLALELHLTVPEPIQGLANPLLGIEGPIGESLPSQFEYKLVCESHVRAWRRLAPGTMTTMPLPGSRRYVMKPRRCRARPRALPRSNWHDTSAAALTGRCAADPATTTRRKLRNRQT